MMSQSCDLTAHVMVGNASQQEHQQQQLVTMDTTEPVVDVKTVENLTQLSQRLSSSEIGKDIIALHKNSNLAKIFIALWF